MAPQQPPTVLADIHTLISDLRSLGIEQGDALLLHVSLSSLGYVPGGAVTVVQALLEVIGPSGTLVVPTHSTDNTDPSGWKDPPVPQDWWPAIRATMPAYDARITPTRQMGAVADAVRQWPGAMRSQHPQTSFAAVGAHAEEITSDHAIDCMLGDQSPLGKLEKLSGGARVLLLGVGFDACTAFHLAEYRRQQPATAANSFALSVNGHRAWVTVTDVDLNGEDFGRLGEDFATKRQLTTGEVGAAPCYLFPLAEAVNYATLWMRSNR